MNDDPDSPSTSLPAHSAAAADAPAGSLRAWLRKLGWRRDNGHQVRDTLDELIEERDEAEVPVDADERRLIANILELRDRKIWDVMVPRADIVALDVQTSFADLVATMTKAGHSRIPVFRETLDDALGMVHIKDVLAWHGRESEFSLTQVMRPVMFVSPFMRVPDLLLEMRLKRCHMALVVDEFGGIDGLVTIEDLVEEIVGEIEDEHDRDPSSMLVQRGDNTLDASARARIEDLEDLLGPFASEDERENIDTLGGLVFALAGRVAARGELIAHPSGVEFEVVDADPRRIKRLRVRCPRRLPADRG